MGDSFFGFNTEFPTSTLGKRKLDEEFLTDDVDEEEYDALNDETFGGGADDGNWEEDHDKFAELVGKEQPYTRSHLSPFFDSCICDGDETQQEIVSRSISQLGLEDDLDDPAIMTIGRSQRNIWPVESSFRSSPPPPAIIDPELCGSPKTHSIWSTNQLPPPGKDSGIGSLFPSISGSTSSYQPVLSFSPSPANVFQSPVGTPKALTLEEVEKSLKTPIGGWASTPHRAVRSSRDSVLNGISSETLNRTKPCLNDVPELLLLPKTPPVQSGVRTLDDVENDILLKRQAPTVDEIERHIQSSIASKRDVKSIRWSQPLDGRLPFPAPIGTRPVPRAYQPIVPPAFPCGPIFPPRLLGNPVPVPIVPKGNDPRFAGLYERMPLRPLFYPTSVLDPQRMNLAFIKHGRIVRHPLLQESLHRENSLFHFGDPHPGRLFFDSNGYDCASSSPQQVSHFKIQPSTGHDEYAGLMSQREKEWLLRIQLMLVQTDNPYVEDYYYSTFLTRKCAEALKNSGKKESPKLLLPERGKPESKAYVPAQFEGSLGKLQAVSVNFPRKVLDITVKRPVDDEEGQVVTNQSLMKYRRLLLDIEKMYNYLLEMDDEEKRILALPDDAHEQHLQTITKLAEKIMSGLACEKVATDDTFQNVMGIRKGRNLGMRSFKIFSKSQKLCILTAVFHCFSYILRKDQNDMILVKNNDVILDFIKTLNLHELVLLGESLENLPRTDSVIVMPSIREKSNFISAFKNKLGSSVVCCLLEQAEGIYSRMEPIESETATRWVKVVLHIVDIICALPESSVMSPSTPHAGLLMHFQRFPVDRDKFEVLKSRVNIFGTVGANHENAV